MQIYEVDNGQLIVNRVNTVSHLSADTTFILDTPITGSRQYVIDIAVDATPYQIGFQGYNNENLTFLDVAGSTLPTLEANSRYIIMLYEVYPSQFNFTIKKVEGMTI